MSQARKRSNSSLSSNQDKPPSASAKKMLKSLITLDSYEQDLADNVQDETVWGEAKELVGTSQNSTKSSQASVETPEADAEFIKAEAERDAELPEELRKFRPRGYRFKLPPKDRPVRIYADGVFDLFHLGHMKQLEQAKKSLPNVIMVVGVPNDELTHKCKGLTVLDENQRYESLRHCRWVDEVITDAPWEVNQEFLEKHRIDYVAHDDAPYAGPDGQGDVYKFVKEHGQFMATQRTDGVSTSDIITRIIKDYDLYLMRNFQRGVSRKELNVSWIKKNELDIKRHVIAFRNSWRNNVETTTRDIYADLLAYALNAPSNSVLGRARNWVSRHIESRNGSPHGSDIETDSPKTEISVSDDEDQSSEHQEVETIQNGKDAPSHNGGSAESQASTPPKRRRLDSTSK